MPTIRRSKKSGSRSRRARRSSSWTTTWRGRVPIWCRGSSARPITVSVPDADDAARDRMPGRARSAAAAAPALCRRRGADRRCRRASGRRAAASSTATARRNARSRAFAPTSCLATAVTIGRPVPNVDGVGAGRRARGRARRRDRRAVPRRRGPGARLLARSGSDRAQVSLAIRATAGSIARAIWRRATPDGTLIVPGPRRLAGQDPRLSHRARRDRSAPGGVRRRARGRVPRAGRCGATDAGRVRRGRPIPPRRPISIACIATSPRPLPAHMVPAHLRVDRRLAD